MKSVFSICEASRINVLFIYHYLLCLAFKVFQIKRCYSYKLITTGDSRRCGDPDLNQLNNPHFAKPAL